MINCSAQQEAGDLGNTTSEADGSIDTNISEAVPVNPVDSEGNPIDPEYNIDITKGDINIAFTFSKEDIRNKLVLIQSNEDQNVVYIPLNADVELPENLTAIIYEELSETDPNYKYLKLYIPDAIQKFPRGTYTLQSYVNVPKIIGNNVFDNWELLSTQKVTLKTQAIQGRLLNNKYLKTAFRRNVTGLCQGVKIPLDNRPADIEVAEPTAPVLIDDGEVGTTTIEYQD